MSLGTRGDAGIQGSSKSRSSNPSALEVLPLRVLSQSGFKDILRNQIPKNTFNMWEGSILVPTDGECKKSPSNLQEGSPSDSDSRSFR